MTEKAPILQSANNDLKGLGNTWPTLLFLVGGPLTIAAVFAGAIFGAGEIIAMFSDE